MNNQDGFSAETLLVFAGTSVALRFPLEEKTNEEQ
jgi:hypothetical protein